MISENDVTLQHFPTQAVQAYGLVPHHSWLPSSVISHDHSLSKVLCPNCFSLCFRVSIANSYNESCNRRNSKRQIPSLKLMSWKLTRSSTVAHHFEECGSKHRSGNSTPGHQRPQQPSRHLQPSASSHRSNKQPRNPIVTHERSNNDSKRSSPSQRLNHHRQTSNTAHQHSTHPSRAPALVEEQGRSRHSQPGSSSQHARPLFPDGDPEWVPDFIVNKHCTKSPTPAYLGTRRALIRHLRAGPHYKELRECRNPDCWQVCRSFSAFLAHGKVYERTLSKRCNKCNATFDYQQHLNRHKRNAHYRVQED